MAGVAGILYRLSPHLRNTLPTAVALRWLKYLLFAPDHLMDPLVRGRIKPQPRLQGQGVSDRIPRFQRNGTQASTVTVQQPTLSPHPSQGLAPIDLAHRNLRALLPGSPTHKTLPGSQRAFYKQ